LLSFTLGIPLILARPLRWTAFPVKSKASEEQIKAIWTLANPSAAPMVMSPGEQERHIGKSPTLRRRQMTGMMNTQTATASIAGAPSKALARGGRASRMAIAGLLLAACASGSVLAEQQPADGAYRGTLVCEHLQGAQGILRAPLDVTVTGGSVVASRPIFNRDGTHVVGTEIATGTLNADGALNLASTWSTDGVSFKAAYNGTLTAMGGTLTGTEIWVRPAANGGTVSRTCYGAYVKAPTLGQ
jgi:hypothetical protein